MRRALLLAVLLLVTGLVAPAEASRVWQSGWESNETVNDSAEWVAIENATHDTAVVRTGTYSGKLTVSGFFETRRGLNLSTAVVRDYFRFSAAPSAVDTFIMFRHSGTTNFYLIRLNTSRQIVAENQVTFQVDATGTTVLAVDTWYKIEAKLVVGNGTGSIQVWIDGVSEFSVGSLNTGTINVDSVYFRQSGGTYTVYHDDAAIDDANQPGSGSIINLAPNGDGTLNSWTSEGTSPHFDSCDDWPGAADDDTTYCYAPNKTDATANFDLTSTPSNFDPNAVNAIMALVRYRAEADTAESAPSVVVRTTTPISTSSTSHTINFTQTTGNLVVIFHRLNDTAQAVSTIGDGFTNLTNTTATFHIYYKELAGSEGGNVVITFASTTRGAAIAYNISGHVAPGTQAPEFSTVATGTSATPDPGSISPTGGSKAYLFLAAFGMNGEEADDDTWCNSGPTSYTNLTQTSAGIAGGASLNGEVCSAERQNTTATEDPGTFSTDQSLGWRAYTVAVHPPAASADTVDIYTQLRRSDESTAITTELTVATAVGTSYVTKLLLMTPTGTHTKAQWDAARVAVRQDYTLNGGADTTARLRVTADAYSVDYIPGAPAAGCVRKTLALLGVGC